MATVSLINNDSRVNVSLSKNDLSSNVNLIKGASQDKINELYSQTKALKEATQVLKDASEINANNAEQSALEALNSANSIHTLTTSVEEGLVSNVEYDNTLNNLHFTLVKGDKGDTGLQGIQGVQGIQGKGIDTVISSKVDKTTTVTITGNFDNSPKTFDILDGSDSSGDMLKSIYDTNNNGIIDNAEMLSLDTTNVTAPTTLGQMKWNQEESTADLYCGNLTLQLGQEQVVRVRNDYGSIIPNGTVVMATGTNGNSGRILVKPHTGTQTLANTILGITTEDIGINQDGFVTVFGKVRGINTTGSIVGETWIDGTKLYLKPNDNGNLTSVEPTNTDINMPIAYVIHSHTSGTLFVRITGVDENANNNLFIQDNAPTISSGKQALWIDTSNGDIQFNLVIGE